MTNHELLKDSASHAYINVLQGIINRLANNSANCKTWCVTLISAIIVLAIDKKCPDAILFAFIPTVFFAFLDAYYLSMERDFRRLHENFVKEPATSLLFQLSIPSGRWRRAGVTCVSMMSFSVVPAYILLCIALKLCSNLLLCQ